MTFHTFSFDIYQGTMINPRCEGNNTPNNCSIPSSSMQRQKQLLSNQTYLLSGSEGTVANQMRHNQNAPMPIFPRNQNAFASMQLATAPLPVTGNLSSLSSNNVINAGLVSFENRNPQQSISSMQPLPVNILGFNKFQHVPKSFRNVPESSNACNVYSKEQLYRSQINAGSSREIPMRVSSGNAFNGSCLSNSADMMSDKSYKRCQFPHKLYEMLMKADSMGYSHVVSFLPHGRAFIVRDKGLFEERVLPMFFSHKSFNSFRR